MRARRLRATGLVFALLALVAATPALADQLVADDLVVQGSICTGFDCNDGEAFGTDTVRLEENNTRIAFADTSAGAGEPGADWEITANDSASGGANRLGVLQTDTSSVAFNVLSGAGNDTLHISGSGAVIAANGGFLAGIDPTVTSNPAGVATGDVLTDLVGVPMSTWRFAADASADRHVGPDGAEFNAAIGVGSGSDVATSDLLGVALAALRDVDASVAGIQAGPVGDRGAVGPAGQDGTPGRAGRDGRDGRDGVTPVGADAALLRRIALVGARQSGVTLRTRLLELRVSSASRGIQSLPR